MTFPDEIDPPRESLISIGLQFARQETRLREFVHAKQAAGLISEEQAREILTVNDEPYRHAGLVRSRGDQEAIHNLTEVKKLVAAQRQGVKSLKDKLLQFHPEMADEVNRLSPPGRGV